jgi:hypothetical protein
MRLTPLRVFASATVALAVWSCGESSTSPGGGGPAAAPTFTVVLDSGIVDSANAPVGSVVTVRVKVTNAGAPAVLSTVTWTVGTGHGSVSATSSATDSSGRASIAWTLGDSVGLNSLTAASGDGSVQVRAIGIANIASSLAKVTLDSSAVVAGASLPIIVRVIDRFGNPVVGATVNWTSTGGAFSVTTSTSGSQGNVQTTFTTPSKPGVFSVTATLPGKASVIFQVVGL